MLTTPFDAPAQDSANNAREASWLLTLIAEWLFCRHDRFVQPSLGQRVWPSPAMLDSMPEALRTSTQRAERFQH
jgi:hypothetical protein